RIPVLLEEQLFEHVDRTVERELVPAACPVAVERRRVQCLNPAPDDRHHRSPAAPALPPLSGYRTRSGHTRPTLLPPGLQSHESHARAGPAAAVDRPAAR